MACENDWIFAVAPSLLLSLWLRLKPSADHLLPTTTIVRGWSHSVASTLKNTEVFPDHVASRSVKWGYKI